MQTTLIDSEYSRLDRIWKGLPEEDKVALLETFAINSTYNSGAIENSRITLHDTSEIFDHDGVSSYTGSLRTLYEINNHRDAWDSFWARGFDFGSLNLSSLLSLHYELTKGTYDERRFRNGERPGTLKLGWYQVADGVGYHPEEVRQALDALLDELSDYSLPLPCDKAIVVVSYLHAMLLEIHPFADGNGRTARFLCNMMLIANDTPPIIFRQEDKLAYYAALDAFHQDDYLGDLVLLSKVETIRTWAKTLEVYKDDPEYGCSDYEDR